MKLVHPDIEAQIDFSSHEGYCLIIENLDEFYKKTNELYDQFSGGEGNWVLSEGFNEISIQNNMLFIYDYYGFVLNTKKICGMINEKVQNALKYGDYLQEIEEIKTKMVILNEKILSEIDIPIVYDELNNETFAKLSNYKVNEDIDLFDRILTYIDVYSKIKNIRFVTFVNLSFYFEKDKIKKLIKQFDYMEINYLFVESVDNNLLEDAKIIIDKDLCEI